MTHAKTVTSTSGRTVRTKSGIEVKQPVIPFYNSYEHEWKDRRKFATMERYFRAKKKELHRKGIKGLKEFENDEFIFTRTESEIKG